MHNVQTSSPLRDWELRQESLMRRLAQALQLRDHRVVHSWPRGARARASRSWRRASRRRNGRTTRILAHHTLHLLQPPHHRLQPRTLFRSDWFRLRSRWETPGRDSWGLIGRDDGQSARSWLVSGRKSVLQPRDGVAQLPLLVQKPVDQRLSLRGTPRRGCWKHSGRRHGRRTRYMLRPRWRHD